MSSSGKRNGTSRWLVLPLAIAILAALSGCGGGSGASSTGGSGSPASAVSSYLAAFAAGNGKAVCDALTLKARAAVDSAGGSVNCPALVARAHQFLGSDASRLTSAKVSEETSTNSTATMIASLDGHNVPVRLQRIAGQWRIDTTGITNQLLAAPSTAGSPPTGTTSSLGGYIKSMIPVQKETGTADLLYRRALSQMDEAHDTSWQTATKTLYGALKMNDEALKTAKRITAPAQVSKLHQREVTALQAQNRAIFRLLFDLRSNAPTKSSLRLGSDSFPLQRIYRKDDCSFVNHLRVLALGAGIRTSAAYWTRLC